MGELADEAVQNSFIQALTENLRTELKGKPVRVIETHISWVILAGDYAYKIKKSVDFGFLNFTSLSLRKYYCAEEIRLNRRFAPAVYLDVVSIGGCRERPLLGTEPAIEYAVRMRRFSVSKQFDHLLARHKLLPQHIDSLADALVGFHHDLPAALESAGYGSAETIRLDVRQNFDQMQPLLKKKSDLDKLSCVRHMSESEYELCRTLFQQRQEQGFIRECHGDLHLGNIVLLEGEAVPFDGIEFNPALRWIDVISEVAFTAMDLLQHQRGDLACRFLNRYLENSGDYQGVVLLRFYLSYRAMVRAKVAALRAAQQGIASRAETMARAVCRNYLKLAERCLLKNKPALIITHGLPGSGKSTFAQIALQRLQAIRLRSDVERKRLYGLGSLADSHALGCVDLYSAEVTQRTYARLNELAKGLLLAGYSVIVDAAFITRNERAQFYQLAQELSVPFAIAAVSASRETLRGRIRQRQQAANDPSEADVTVMEKLMLSYDPLTPAERERSAEFCNEGVGIVADEAGWNRLEELLV